MMSKMMIIGVSGALIVLIVVIGSVLLGKAGNKAPSPTPTTVAQTAPTTTTTTTTGSVKTFTVEGGDFFFKPNTIKVKKGDTVKITFQNSDGMHDFVIDEFKVRTKIIRDGESVTVEFVADKAGSFEYYCSVQQHKKLGMKGTLTVE